jgi:hypothetical protein
MNNIHDILARLDAIQEGLGRDQERVQQLPALFKPKSASPALAGAYPTLNATRGYLVGEEEELGTVFEPGIENTAEYRQGHSAARDAKNPHQEGTTAWTRWLKGRMDRIGPKAAQGGFMKKLQEEMTEIEEDMLSKVKKDLTNYLDMLEKKVRVDRDLRDKAVDAVEKGQAEEDDEVAQEPVEEDPTTQDMQSEPPPPPQEDSITAESFAVKTVTMEDGNMLEIHGDQGRGFEIRRSGKCMPSRFRSLDEAEMAIELFRNRRKSISTNQDYLDEA